jgi:formamidopyrimidine-DNA glycosylase
MPYLASAFDGRKTPVKAALLDQRIVAGLGQYLCLRSAVPRRHLPLRAAGRIGLGRSSGCATIRSVLAEAIEAGGSSLRDYRQADGELGYFQHAFRVYGREGQPASPMVAHKPCASCNQGDPASIARLPEMT